MKTLFLFFFCSALMAADIDGYWKSINETTGKPQCVVAVYEYDGLHYGRIIGTYDPNGVMTETIYNPKGRAPGILGNPFYCGMDLIWALDDAGSKFKGKIVDPEKGNVYNAELWVDGDNLIVRGKLLMFGRSQKWLPVSLSEFPKGFKQPDIKKWVPVIPEVN
jgi:uncharacterized protein (DUF2147 family)